MTWNRWKIAAIVVCSLFWLAVGVGASKAYPLPVKDAAALADATSWIAQAPTTVNCLNHDEPESPWGEGAWAYVTLFDPTVYADVQVCEGALAIVHGDKTVPLWEQALGALALTHESYHLRRNLSDRGDEAATECRAIRHTAYMIQRLGGDQALVSQLMPFALAIHWQLAAKVPAYNLKKCKVPWYW